MLQERCAPPPNARLCCCRHADAGGVAGGAPTTAPNDEQPATEPTHPAWWVADGCHTLLLLLRAPLRAGPCAAHKCGTRCYHLSGIGLPDGQSGGGGGGGGGRSQQRPLCLRCAGSQCRGDVLAVMNAVGRRQREEGRRRGGAQRERGNRCAVDDEMQDRSRCRERQDGFPKAGAERQCHGGRAGWQRCVTGAIGVSSQQ